MRNTKLGRDLKDTKQIGLEVPSSSLGVYYGAGKALQGSSE